MSWIVFLHQRAERVFCFVVLTFQLTGLTRPSCQEVTELRDSRVDSVTFKLKVSLSWVITERRAMEICYCAA